MNARVFFRSMIYWVMPPIFWRCMKYLRKSKAEVNNRLDDSYTKALDEFEEKGISFFIDESSVGAFCRMKRYMHQHELPRHDAGPSVLKHLSELNDFGYTFFDDFLSTESLEAINLELRDLLCDELKYLESELEKNDARVTSRIIERQHKKVKVIHNIYDGVIRVWGLESRIPFLAEIANNSEIQKVAESYLGGIISPSRVYLDIKAFSNATDSSVTLHTDSHTKILKIFIALEDGNDDSAPLFYFTGSHRQHKFRLLKDYLDYAGVSREYYDYFSTYNPISMMRMVDEGLLSNVKPERLSLKAGQAIMADTSGIHGATNLLSGRRVQLGMVFEQRGYGAADTFPQFGRAARN